MKVLASWFLASCAQARPGFGVWRLDRCSPEAPLLIWWLSFEGAEFAWRLLLLLHLLQLLNVLTIFM